VKAAATTSIWAANRLYLSRVLFITRGGPMHKETNYRTGITLAVDDGRDQNAAGMGLAVFRLQLVFALLFFTIGATKLAGSDLTILGFEFVGLGQWFRYFSGLADIIGAVCFLLPRMIVIGALFLLGVMLVTIGATIAQLGHDASNPVQTRMPPILVERIYAI
jgi:uncharacterized membrane protein YphA (DoxX/SURF4 family)